VLIKVLLDQLNLKVRKTLFRTEKFQCGKKFNTSEEVIEYLKPLNKDQKKKNRYEFESKSAKSRIRKKS
jgi:hypothetical protein